MATERDFLRNLQQQFPPRPPVLHGIGDDGSIVDTSGHDREVVVADMLLDGVHFDGRITPPNLIGRKALAVNISDLAAMGCRPTAAYICLAIPRGTADRFLAGVYDGLQLLADEFDCHIAGGDTNSWDGPFVISVTVTGIPFGDHIPLRSQAQDGDFVCVTGPLGGSLPSDRHLTFVPRLAESRSLLQQTAVNAMMDISDGLSLDLSRLAEASGVGAVLEAEQIPIHVDVDAALTDRQRLQHALHDGEDFELLVTLPEDPRQWSRSVPLDVPLFPIGRITSAREGVWLQTAAEIQPLRPDGWQHSV